MFCICQMYRYVRAAHVADQAVFHAVIRPFLPSEPACAPSTHPRYQSFPPNSSVFVRIIIAVEVLFSSCLLPGSPLCDPLQGFGNICPTQSSLFVRMLF